MSEQNPTSKARYVPDSELVSPVPAGARIAFIPAEGDDGSADYVSADDLGSGSPLGGTDGDGNVYSIEFNADGQALQLKCITLGGDGSFMQVGPGYADILFSPDSGPDHRVQVTAAGVILDGVLVDPTQPWPGG